MKKNKMMRLASILLVCVLLTTSVISGTFAKYISDATATDTARVAKWSFEVGSGDSKKNIATETTFTFDLFKTINDTKGGAEETDVVKGTDALKIIAPGTEGSFDIVLTNTSEVTAKYAIDYTVTNTIGDHIQFSIDGGNTWTDTLADVAASEADDETNTVLAKENGTKTIKVQWKWAFEGADDYDDVDTQLGIEAAANNAKTLVVTAKITAIQVD